MNKLLRVGLTGGIGSGKTTVCNYFIKHDVPIIDADIISRKVVEPGAPGLNNIIKEFGTSVLTKNHQLDRVLLRKLIFNNFEQREKLNSILHPLIYKEIDRQIYTLSAPYCIISIPLLIETGGDKYVDRILLVDTEVESQLERASARDDSDQTQIGKIVHSQTSRESRLSVVDDIINNDGNLEELEKCVDNLHQFYLDLAKKTAH